MRLIVGGVEGVVHSTAIVYRGAAGRRLTAIIGVVPSPRLAVPRFEPMPLARLADPFDHPDWIFELKYDGFRGLAYAGSGKCELISRNGNHFKQFGQLEKEISSVLNSEAVIDGEIVCLDSEGKPQFYDLFRRRPPHFCAFDLLWLDGKDLRSVPLLERKRRLRELLRPPVIFVDHFDQGVEFFRAVCEKDLEGIVAKLKLGKYQPDETTWVKIKNRNYSQTEGRHEFFGPSRGRAR